LQTEEWVVILKVPEDCACDVFDASGVRLEYVVWCDTETGEAVHIVQPLEFTIDDDGEAGVRKEWRQHPAPLKFNRHR
jgi:hypothetical protein